jgi:hypothetical protein
MRLSARPRAWLIALGATLLVLGSLGVIAFQPWAANHFHYALPGSGGLPFRVSYYGRDYANTGMCAHASWCRNAPTAETACRSQQQLMDQNEWPLAQVGSVPTLFGPSHAVFAPPVPAGYTVMQLYVEESDGCSISYGIEGGP